MDYIINILFINKFIKSIIKIIMIIINSNIT